MGLVVVRGIDGLGLFFETYVSDRTKYGFGCSWD